MENQVSTVALFRKSAWEHVGGFHDWGNGKECVPEDWEFFVRMMGNGFAAKAIREPLMLYRVHGGSLSGGCTSTVEYQREAIRKASPNLFRKRYQPPKNPLVRPAPMWDGLMEAEGGPRTILLVLPLITIGGAEKLFQTIGEVLVRRGYKVLVMSTAAMAPLAGDCTEDFEAVTPYVYPLSRLLTEEDCWEDFLRYVLKRHRVDTIVNVGSDFLYRLLPEIKREFPQTRIFDQLFNDDVHYVSNRHYAACLDGTIVPSPALADKLLSEGGEQASKVSVIPHGVRMEAPAPAAFDGSGLPEAFRGKFLVSFFGRLAIEKAPADFVEIARLLREYSDIRFLMTGDGSERPAVMASIDRYQLADRIHAPGFVDNVQTLMALSDVVVLPSRLDGMPLVIFEAQVYGKPVVASAVGSIPHVIEDGKSGVLCRPGDVHGFADRILKLWRSPDWRRSIAEEGRASVRANHSADAMTDRYIEVFEGAHRAIGYNKA
jgi:glycosyltransferase involved in cell wall biosynthesis